MDNFTQKQRDSPWKRRYRIPVTYGLQIAALNPTHGLALSTRSGAEQLYAWQVQTGELTQLTSRPEGTGNTGDSIPNAFLSPDGSFVYHFNDVKGTEAGHFVRVPFTGGSLEDLTPDLPDYTGFSLTMSATGNRCGFTMLHEETSSICCVDIRPDGSVGQRRIMYEEQMHALGKSIEVVWFDAGHGSIDTEERIAQQELMLHFAYQVLNGWQE